MVLSAGKRIAILGSGCFAAFNRVSVVPRAGVEVTLMPDSAHGSHLRQVTTFIYFFRGIKCLLRAVETTGLATVTGDDDPVPSSSDHAIRRERLIY